jgi:hypothetical protein
MRLDVDVEPTLGARPRGAKQRAVKAGQRRDACAAGQAAALDDLGDRADFGVGAFVARDEQDARLVGRLERQRHRHVRKDDAVVQRYKEVVLHDQVHTPELVSDP